MGNKLTKEQFVDRANKIHNFKYDYTNVKYINTYTKVNIICTEHNNEYWQLPSNHLSGHGGCKICTEIMKQKACQIKYGCNHPSQSKKVQDKIKQTNLEKYGVEYAIASNTAREKSKQTMQLRYGCDYAQQSTAILQKTKDTNLKNYGVENVFQSEEIKEKSKQTNLEKYNCFDPGNSEKFRQKAKESSLLKYGVEYYEQLQISSTSLKLLNDIEYLKEQQVKGKTFEQIASTLHVSHATVRRYLKKFGIYYTNIRRSMGEMSVETFINLLGYETISNTREILQNRYEIDIFIPEISKAIEYNGIYWHRGKGKTYHKDKTENCNKLNIPLIHIWEDKWNNNQEKTKDILVKFLNDIPQHPLTESIEIDLATDNPQIYKDLGYHVLSQSHPKLYLDEIWDCGTMVLQKLN